MDEDTDLFGVEKGLAQDHTQVLGIWLENSWGRTWGLGRKLGICFGNRKMFKWLSSFPTPRGMGLWLFLPQSHKSEGKLAEVKPKGKEHFSSTPSHPWSPEALFCQKSGPPWPSTPHDQRCLVFKKVAEERGRALLTTPVGTISTYCTTWRSCRRALCPSVRCRGLSSGGMEMAGTQGLPRAFSF